jgi:hypothetical protein
MTKNDGIILNNISIVVRSFLKRDGVGVSLIVGVMRGLIVWILVLVLLLVMRRGREGLHEWVLRRHRVHPNHQL